jgi:hypothetical protein
MSHPAQTLPCPSCHAAGGQPCIHLTTAGEISALPGWVHPARERAWRPVAERLRAAARRLAPQDETGPE